MVVERSNPSHPAAAAYLTTHAAPGSPSSQDGAFLSPMTPGQLDGFPPAYKTP